MLTSILQEVLDLQLCYYYFLCCFTSLLGELITYLKTHSAHIKSVAFYIVAICVIVNLHTLLHAQFVGTFVIYHRSRSSCIASNVDQLLT